MARRRRPRAVRQAKDDRLDPKTLLDLAVLDAWRAIGLGVIAISPPSSD
jgi:hypothetical protein